MNDFFWTRIFTPVISAVPATITNIAQGEIVNLISQAGDESLVRYVSRSEKVFLATVKTVYLEPYKYATPVVDMSGYQTPTLQDAAQYLKIGTRTIYNACGIISICRCMSLSVEQIFTIMKEKTPAYYNSIMANQGLGTDAIEKISVAAGAETKRLKDTLMYGTHFVYSPMRIREVIDAGWKIIFGVKIDSRGYVSDYGRLTSHWVVLEYLRPFGINNASMTFYNPYNEEFEETDYREFMASAFSWSSFSAIMCRRM